MLNLRQFAVVDGGQQRQQHLQHAVEARSRQDRVCCHGADLEKAQELVVVEARVVVPRPVRGGCRSTRRSTRPTMPFI